MQIELQHRHCGAYAAAWVCPSEQAFNILDASMEVRGGYLWLRRHVVQDHGARAQPSGEVRRIDGRRRATVCSERFQVSDRPNTYLDETNLQSLKPPHLCYM